MVEVANILLPIFAVIALGAVLRYSGFASIQVFQHTNRLVYWIGIPAYLFYKTADSKLQGDAAVRVFGVLFGAMVVTIALAYLVARLLQLQATSTSAFVHGAFRSNLVYVGLPVVFLALAARGYEQLPELQATAVISIALLVPIYNAAAVLVLVGGHEGGREQLPKRLRELVTRLVTNPLILSCVAGLVVLALGWTLPQPIRQTCETLGDMTTPLALLGIGAALNVLHFARRLAQVDPGGGNQGHCCTTDRTSVGAMVGAIDGRAAHGAHIPGLPQRHRHLHHGAANGCRRWARGQHRGAVDGAGAASAGRRVGVDVRLHFRHAMCSPPSTSMTVPVMKSACTKKRTASATSCALPHRPSKLRAAAACICLSV